MKSLTILATLLLLFFFFVQDTLQYAFVSDDFCHINFEKLTDAIHFRKDIYHYIPIYWLTMLGMRKFFGINPYPFHLVAVTLHLLNILLVFFLAKAWFKSEKRSLIASSIFAFFFSHYEVVYWVTGIATSLMVAFYLLGLLSLTHFTRSFHFRSYLLHVLFFLLGLLSHEYAISLLFVSFLYWILFSKQGKVSILKIGKLFIFPLLSVALLTLLKVTFSTASLVASTPTVPGFFASVTKTFLYLFLQIPYLVDRLPKAFLAPVFILLLLLLVKKSTTKKINLFLLSWTTIVVAIFSATSLPQARYFYLTSIPSTLLITSLLPVDKWKFHVRGSQINLLNLLSLIYVVLIVTSGMVFLQEQKKHWFASSEITGDTIRAVKASYPIPNKDRNLYFVNLPDSVNGPPWNAYAFRNCLEKALELSYGFKPGKIYFFRAIPRNSKTRDDPFIEPSRLRLLKEEGQVIFVYNGKIGRVHRY